MDTAILSAVAALGGSFIGGLSSVLTSWLTQRSQHRSQRRINERSRREALYSDYINEASRLYGRAIEADRPQMSDMVNLLGMVSRIRLYAEPATVKATEDVVQKITTTYFAPPISLESFHALQDTSRSDPLRTFSELARAELKRVES